VSARTGPSERGARIDEVLMVNGWPKCGTKQVSRELAAELSVEVRGVLEPLLKEIESLNERIKEYDARMEKIARESYPHIELLKQVKGVGTRSH